MAQWNKVLSGFDAEDETVNFGARTVAENYDSIYETTTLATIQADGEVVKNPKVVASIQDATLCVTIDKSITIFSDKSCQDIKLCIGFDSFITAHCMSKNSCFLFVTLDNGTLYCLNLEAGGRLVFFRKVIPTSEFNCGEVIIKVFLRDAEEQNDPSDVLLVTSRAQIYKISGFDVNVMNSVIDVEDIGRLEELTQHIKCCSLFAEHQSQQVAAAEIGFLHNEQTIVMIGDQICLWPRQQFCTFNALPYKYVKVQYLQRNRLLLCLRTDGALNVVCSSTLLAKKVWDGPASDMVLIEDGAEAPIHILVLLTPHSNSSTTFLQLVSFPDFDIKFNLQVPITTYLVNTDSSMIDEIVFLEGVGKTITIDTVKIKAVEENLPEYRLQRLLRREKYEEADIFARRFNLNTDMIYCAKAASLTKDFNNLINDRVIISRLDELVNTLDKIKNVKLVFEFCHNVVTSDFKQTRQLISYARERLIKNAEKISDDVMATYLFNINNTLLRIETYEMILRTMENTSRSNSQDIDNWVTFSRSDLLKECKTHLMNGELKVAALIWVRHAPTLLGSITTGVVRTMLEIIPDKMPHHDLWPWLVHFVPSLLSMFPDGLSEIVTWGYKKAKSFEEFDQKNWPERGIDFCKDLMKLLNFEDSQSFFHLQQQYTTKHSPLQHLTALLQALTDLQRIKGNYRFIVKVADYMGEPIEVTYSLLRQVHPQKVSEFIKNFLQQYILNHSLKNDYVLTVYIQKTLRNSRGWWFWEEAPWEQKVASVIACIHNVGSRLQQILETLKKVSVPWSPAILALVESNISIKHPLVSAIITERNSVPTKLILKKYGYQHIGITDTLIKYIIKQNRDGMLEDLNELTKSNHSLKMRALSFCINFLLNKSDLEQTMTAITSQSNEDAVYCCKQVINYVTVCLSFKEMNNTPKYYAELLGVMEVKLKSILSNINTEISEVDDTLKTASELKSICLIRHEFGINLSLTTFQTESELFLQQYLKTLCDDLNNETVSTFTAYKKAGMIADLLGLPRILAVCMLLEISPNMDIFKYYIEGVKGVEYFTAEECPYIRRLSRICIIDLDKRELEALSNLKDISASAVNYCLFGELEKILLMTVWTNLSVKMLNNQGLGGTDLKNRTPDTIKWRLYKIYMDSALYSSQIVLPFFMETLKFHLCHTDKIQFENNGALAQATYSDQIMDLLAKLKAIPTESYDFSLLQILNNLVCSCSSVTILSTEIILQVRSIRDICLRTLLQKIISARTFDMQSGLSCLHMLSDQDALKWLTSTCKMYQTDYSRLRAVSDLGFEYCHSLKNKSHSNYFAYYRICHYWARKLQDYGIHHKEILTSHTEGKQLILERMMGFQKTGLVDILREFCTDFEFDYDECYILYLDVLLKQWNPTMQVIVLNTEKELKINEEEVTTLQKTCRQVAALIEDKSAMRKHLAALWSKINFYHYEVFLVIMELLDDRSETRFNHFCFLQNYIRFGAPTQIEYEEWSLLSPDNNSLPEISKWRLPYLPKVDQYKLITPELNLSTYEKWMEVASVLNLQVHVICTMAIKGTMTQVWGSTDDLKKRNSNEWLIHAKNSALLEDIKTCIKHMPDQDALYYDTAVLYYVVNYTPPGADQAAAAQECYTYAQKWAQASLQSDVAMTEKIRYKYLQLTTKHILHTHGLGTDRYLQLAVTPERLVCELYMDESIVLRSRGATEHRPDINSAVNALGKLHSLNVIQLRLELLEEWLQPNYSNTKFDESMTCNIMTGSSATEDDSVDDDNLLRACYVLEWGDKVMSANYLINIGFGEKSETIFRPGIQFRALHVLLSILDSANVQDLTKRDLKSIKQYMKSLQYVSRFERLGFTFSVQRFENSSKLELAQALSQSHRHVPEALVLILEMCIDFGLKNYVLWDETLSAMSKMCMVRELAKFLPKVATVSHVVGCNGFVKGWEILIWDPFRRSDALLSEKQFKECVTSICLLHSCPVPEKLNLTPIMKICMQSNHPELGAALLPFLAKNDTNFVAETIKSSCDVVKVIEDLRTLLIRGVLTISYSVRILEELLQSDSVKN